MITQCILMSFHCSVQIIHRDDGEMADILHLYFTKAFGLQIYDFKSFIISLRYRINWKSDI